MTKSPDVLSLSGQRLRATYCLQCSKEDAPKMAHDICIEQTVEYPEDLIERADIREQIFGRVASLRPLDGDRFEAAIDFPAEATGGELPQLLNVLLGNISLRPGIRLTDFALPPILLERFHGPRFGRSGLRGLLGEPRRPLVCTALKPMGLSPKQLAKQAFALAMGGIDIIKDDHGLADQSFCRFEERVTRCAEAIRQASSKTGKTSLYFPNVTAPQNQARERAGLAKEVGAGGLLISPGLTGFDTMRSLADDDHIDLPLLCHPAFLGSFSIHPSAGISHGALYGQICRLAGADATIFPSFGGRFSFTEDECRDLAGGTEKTMGAIETSFPVPAGGMRIDRIPSLLEFYGPDVILLIGGDLHRQAGSLTDGCRDFVSRVMGHKFPNRG